jgi:hypothetical protein
MNEVEVIVVILKRGAEKSYQPPLNRSSDRLAADGAPAAC